MKPGTRSLYWTKLSSPMPIQFASCKILLIQQMALLILIKRTERMGSMTIIQHKCSSMFRCRVTRRFIKPKCWSAYPKPARRWRCCKLHSRQTLHQLDTWEDSGTRCRQAGFGPLKIAGQMTLRYVNSQLPNNWNLCFKKGPFHALQHPSQQINLYSWFRQLFLVP